MRVLLLDSTIACIEIYEALKKRCSAVYTLGNRADDYLALVNSDLHILADYSQTSVVQEIITKFNIDVLIPGCTDASLKTYSSLSPNINMDLNDQAISFCLNKDLLYWFFNDIGVTHPVKYSLGDDVSKIIVKPVDAYSGRGISVVDPRDKPALESARLLASENSLSGKITIDHYITGSLVSFSTIMGPKGTTIFSFVEEHCISNKYRVDHSFCLNVDRLQENPRLIGDLEKIRLNLQPQRNVFLHFQAIKADDHYYFIEMMMRHPGDMYSSLVKNSLNIDYSALYVDTFISHQDQSPSIDKNFDINPVLRQTLNATEIFSGFQLSTTDQDFIEIIPMKKVGAAKDNNERVAIIFRNFKKFEHIEQFINEIQNEK